MVTNSNKANDNEGNNENNLEIIDSDSGLEVVEEPTLRPSDLVRGNHNRSMSIISGKKRENCLSCLFFLYLVDKQPQVTRFLLE